VASHIPLAIVLLDSLTQKSLVAASASEEGRRQALQAFKDPAHVDHLL
jgi:hypothetical protein